MDARVITVVKDINGHSSSLYLEKIGYDNDKKEYIKFYKFYDPVKIQKIDKFVR